MTDNKLVEAVARAIHQAQWKGAPEHGWVRCTDEAKAAIAIVLEEAAKIVKDHMGYEGSDSIVARIRALGDE